MLKELIYHWKPIILAKKKRGDDLNKTYFKEEQA